MESKYKKKWLVVFNSRKRKTERVGELGILTSCVLLFYEMWVIRIGRRI